MMNGSSWRGTVEMFRRTETAKGRSESGYYSIEGIRLHERALRAGVDLQKVITTSSFLTDDSPRIQTLLLGLQESGTQVEIVPDSIIEDFTGKRDLGPILGLLKLPQQQSLHDLMTSQKFPLILAAADIKDPGNVGALLRTAHACGATAFAAVGISDPFHPKALRTSMGSLFKMPLLCYEEALPLLAKLEALGIERVGTAVSGGIPLPQATFSKRGSAVFIGSESWGLSPTIQTAVDRLVSIPMVGGVDSFSVNAAAAIVMYEIGRQRYLSDEKQV